MEECACVYDRMDSLIDEVARLLNPLGVPCNILHFTVLAIG